MKLSCCKEEEEKSAKNNYNSKAKLMKFRQKYLIQTTRINFSIFLSFYTQNKFSKRSNRIITDGREAKYIFMKPEVSGGKRSCVPPTQ